MSNLARAKCNVLVLDDDELNLMILENATGKAGYDAKPFLCSEEAWSYLKENPNSIDIAVIDKMMPKIDGIEFLKRMKGNESLKHIPVILQTGDVGKKQMEEGMKNGAYYYLAKPFTPDMLIVLLQSAGNSLALGA